MKFLSAEAALYKSTFVFAWNTCHVWAGASSCYLDIGGKLQKRICRTVDSKLAASLELWNFGVIMEIQPA